MIHKIAYYAHSHGSGHSRYASRFAEGYGSNCVILTDSLYNFPDNAEVQHLPNEDLDGTQLLPDSYNKPKYLHYSPVGLSKILKRNTYILEALQKFSIDLLIVDVSVEIAALARVSSVPYVYRRMPGNRSDLAHTEAYRGALFLLAYYPKDFESIDTPAWIIAKTCYLGFIDKPEKQSIQHEKPFYDITIVTGFGGTAITTLLPVLLAQFPDYSIQIIGPVDPTIKNENITYQGVVERIEDFIHKDTIVIASCGTNMVLKMISLGKKFLAFPEERPYLEQETTATILENLNIAYKVDVHNLKPLIDKAKTFKPYKAPEHYFTTVDKLAAQIQEFFKTVINASKEHEYDINSSV
ncbi:hypothetical protein [Leeuwenhoekiella sp. W20_SRS_FM14]|uniref:hypothetical protein n=1 Tax=Leeuwenhoekiella sp. W20_SRS_FM14 TaxID=3240270 RepID=UPI003F9CB8F7